MKTSKQPSSKRWLIIGFVIILLITAGTYLILSKKASAPELPFILHNKSKSQKMTFIVNTFPLVGGGCSYLVYTEPGQSKEPLECVYESNIKPIFQEHQAEIDKFSTINPNGSRTISGGPVYAKVTADVTIREGTRTPATEKPKPIPTNFLYIDKLHSIEFYQSDKL